MTAIDQALVIFRQDTSNQENQSQFFDLFLNSTFFVPIVPDAELAKTDMPPAAGVLPLIIAADGNDFLMLFDSRERMNAWAESEVECVEVPGHLLAATSAPPLHWALNVGTDYSKQFVPDEIVWLKEAVERCQAEADAAVNPEE
jgi:hypothetical protein